MPKITALIGPPGTGKTTAATTIAKRWFKNGLGPEDVAYLAFTKAAAHEAGRRMIDERSVSEVQKKLPFFRTIHSLAYRELMKAKPDVRIMTTADMKAFSTTTGFEGTYTVHDWEDLSEVYQRLENKGRTDWDRALTAYTLSRISARTPDDMERSRTTMSKIAQKSTDFLPEDVYRVFVEKYERFKTQEGLVDFSDMLEFALTEMRPLNVKKVVIDEAQDLGSVLYSIVDRIFQDAEEIYFAGDEDQCQPAGTMVALTDGGSKPIEELAEGDQVVAFDRRSGLMTGRSRQGCKVLKVASRCYFGDLFYIQAANRTTRATKEHRFIVRWTPEARRSEVCVTYLMEREGRFRLGWCQLFRSDSLLHLIRRTTIEDGDRVWILGVHFSRTDASIHESVLAARHGIPTVIFEQIGDRREQVRMCLEEHGRSLDHPFWEKNRHYHRKKTTVMELEACNLISGLMAIPIFDGTGKPRWEPISVECTKVRDVQVFSLEVERHHTYVADGIVTHNCIYNFAAADAASFIRRVKTAHRRIFLRQTHRFGQDIVQFSSQIIRCVRERVEKEVWGLPGRRHEIKFTGMFKPIVAPMLILHRHVMGCQGLAQLFMQEGLPFRNERGKDPLGARVRVTAFETFVELAEGRKVSPGSLRRLVDELLPTTYGSPDKQENVRLIVHGGKKRLQEGIGNEAIGINDLVSKKILTEKGADVIRMKSLETLKHRFDLLYYQRVLDNGYSLEGKDVPHICTLHGSKGREAPMVVLFAEMGKKCWQDPDAEHRLAYVGATRTQGDLEICKEQSLEWATKPYSYPEPVPDKNPFE